jgi:uncharacterized protein HemX
MKNTKSPSSPTANTVAILVILGGLGLGVGVGIFLYLNQESNLSSLKTGIKALETQINKLPSVTATSKVTITQKIATLEKQINSLPETLPTKKELNRQLSDLQQQIDTFPDNSIPPKDRISFQPDGFAKLKS